MLEGMVFDIKMLQVFMGDSLVGGGAIEQGAQGKGFDQAVVHTSRRARASSPRMALAVAPMIGGLCSSGGAMLAPVGSRWHLGMLTSVSTMSNAVALHRDNASSPLLVSSTVLAEFF